MRGQKARQLRPNSRHPGTTNRFACRTPNGRGSRNSRGSPFTPKIGGWFAGKIPEFIGHGRNYDEASFGTPYNGSLPMVRQANLLTYDFILRLCIRTACE